MKSFDKRINIITGHYGSGKTNLAVNMALDIALGGKKTCLVDLDIVNPYFRASDQKKVLEAAGVRVIAPVYAGSNLDIPALPGEVNAVFDDRSYTVILDVGGDDAGAAALGRYSGMILKENDYEHFYVINARRALTQSPAEAVSILREIEAAGRVPVTALVNNTNLSVETDDQVIAASMDFAQRASDLTGLPVAFASVRKDIAGRLNDLKMDIYPVDIYVKLPW
jgi:hypothetical protein